MPGYSGYIERRGWGSVSGARRDGRAGLDGFLLLLAAFVCTALSVATTLTISPSLLTFWKIQYATSGGTVLEKLHPATYFAVVALILLAARDGNPISGIVRIFAASREIVIYLICWLLLVSQTILLERPFTGVIDTFLLPALLALIVWQMPDQQRRWLGWIVHALILLNVAIGYYEYFSGRRIIPLTLGNVLVVGEWRSAALLGHPLVASGLVAAYVLALALRPRLCPIALIRLMVMTICFGSLMAFGGRTALVTTLGILGIVTVAKVFRFARGGRMSLPALIATILIVFAGAAVVFAALDLGLFDKMLTRFSSDKGSTLARYATWQFLSHFDWSEIIFGPPVVRANALQNQLGLDYGIENFWIACIVQFGLIHTVLINLGLAAFVTKLFRTSHISAVAIIILMLVIAASSVSFSSKNIQLAQFIVLITVLLARRGHPRLPASPAPYARANARYVRWIGTTA